MADLNLTGTWNGQFGYASEHQEPRFFVAALGQAGEWLSGRTEEIAARGPFAGRSITATISFRLAGLQVRSLKTYDLPDGRHDTVTYTGRVDPDGTAISGSWNIVRLSGPFLMVRPAVTQPAIARSQQERV